MDMINSIQLSLRFLFSLWAIFLFTGTYYLDPDFMWGMGFMTAYLIIPFLIIDITFSLISVIRNLLIKDKVKKPRYSSNKYKKGLKIFTQIFIVSVYSYIIFVMITDWPSGSAWVLLPFVYFFEAIRETIMN